MLKNKTKNIMIEKWTWKDYQRKLYRTKIITNMEVRDLTQLVVIEKKKSSRIMESKEMTSCIMIMN